MTEELKKTIKEELAELPKEGQEAIAAFDWIKIAEDIGAKHLLSEEEVDDFILETLLVLIGVVDPEFYAVNIENQVEKTKEEAAKMADEGMREILLPIKNVLVENVKRKSKIKNSDFVQTINFILSGGDYLSFIEEVSVPEESPQATREEIQRNLEKTLGIKDKFVI